MAGLGLAAIDGTVSFRMAQQVLSKARDCRGEIGIVGTALDDRVFLNGCLILSIQIEPSLDRDRAMDTKCLRIRGYKGTYLSPGVRAQFETPLYAVGCRGIASRSQLEAPAGRVSFSRMQCKITAQLLRALESGYRTRSLDFQ